MNTKFKSNEKLSITKTKMINRTKRSLISPRIVERLIGLIDTKQLRVSVSDAHFEGVSGL